MTPPYGTAHELSDAPVVLDRRDGPHGEVVLRRHQGRLQIIANGCFLMDTSDGRSERRLVDAAREALNIHEPPDTREALDTREAPDTRALPDARRALDAGRAPDRPAVLIGGLGVGFSLAHAAADPRWGRITVVERERAIIGWHQDGPFAPLTAEAIADPRTEIVESDLVRYVHETSDTFDALCLDIDNGPSWTVTDDNGSLYTPAGLASCARVLRPGGVLAVWSAQPSPEFEGTLWNAGFQRVRTEEIPVARGVPDVVHLAVRPG